MRLLLLSGIGTPYDPRTGEGVVGKNYAYQTMSGVNVFFDDKVINPFIGAGALGIAIDDFNGDNFDHTGLGFIGGGYHRRLADQRAADRDITRCRRARRSGAASGRRRSPRII